jgi:hypothetical protein
LVRRRSVVRHRSVPLSQRRKVTSRGLARELQEQRKSDARNHLSSCRISACLFKSHVVKGRAIVRTSYPYETHYVYRMQGRQAGRVGPNRLGRTLPHRPVLRLQREAFQQDEIRLQIQLHRGRDWRHLLDIGAEEEGRRQAIWSRHSGECHPTVGATQRSMPHQCGSATDSRGVDAGPILTRSVTATRSAAD